jgi:hypothetical protein
MPDIASLTSVEYFVVAAVVAAIGMCVGLGVVRLLRMRDGE